MSDTPLLEVENLVKVFRGAGGAENRAVNGVSLNIMRGETFGLVGESGSGKSTLGRCILRLMKPDEGTVRFDGEDMADLSAERMRKLRRRIQVVFQDPYTSLNRRQSIEQIISSPLQAHRMGTRAEQANRVRTLLDLVQLPAQFATRRPGDLSGGQAQRVAIARALALNPEFILLDEAVSALDMSVRAQILNLLGELQRELGLTYLFVSHDLSVIRYSCHRVAVMKRGEVVELATRKELFENPKNSYTRQLLDAVPVPIPVVQRARVKAERVNDQKDVNGEITEL